jgi:flagellar M-ring protein FliF
MDFASEKREEKLVTAPDQTNNEGLIISAKKLSETFSGQGTPPGGTSGTGQNDVASFPGTNQQGANSNYEKTDDIVNREVNRITRNIVESPYKLVDLSINVGVEPPNGGQLDQQTMDSIRQVLRNVVTVTLSEKSVALTQAEIDQRISIFPRTFSGKVVVSNQTALNPGLLVGAGILALLALGAVGYIVFRRRKQAKQIQAEIMDFPEPQTFDVPDLQYDENSDEAMVRKQLEKLARSRPDEFVVLLRTWLAED